MLPVANRLTAAPEFTAATRGDRAGARGVVLHRAMTGGAGPPRVGFVVSRAVGGAVVRNRVRRRLREIARPLLPLLPDGSLLVIRALPAAAGLDFAHLGRSVHTAWARLGGETA